MPKQSKPKAKRRVPKSTAAGRALLASLNQALTHARGEHVPGIRVTCVQVNPPAPIDVQALRRKFGLSQSKFAARFGFTPATIRNWEQGRTQPDGPARVLLTVIAHHPEAVEDALRKAS
jgi:putative transcriptional regulator